MEITVTGEKGIRLPRKLLTRAARKVLLSLGFDRAGTEISVLLVRDGTIRALNKKYRGYDKPTDVLSFSVPQNMAACPYTHLGDIVISIETARRSAKKAGHSLSDELVYLLVHGILHLAGYDHENVSDTKAGEMMELQQKLIKGVLGK
ncbi:MAG: rRNA maturation RNase YbeY [Oligoflexia bacterium]|nr:rRNA maturation RNase YbeY [Oligoflexia bacterium]